MHKNTLAVLNVINDNSKDGQAVIMDSAELLADVPQGEEVDLDDIIKELTLTEMIRLKYQDNDVYCVVTLPKGKLIADSNKPQKSGIKGIDPSVINVKIDYKKIAKICFVYGFLGSIIAGTILFVLFVLLFL